MLCWGDGHEDGGENSTSEDEQIILNDLVEIFKEGIRDFGNVRWIFWGQRHLINVVSNLDFGPSLNIQFIF